MIQALSEVRVLELSRVLAGPWAAQTLADLGAEVIKVEHPRGGDDTRAWGPPYLKDEAGQDTTESAYYHCTNRNKRSVAIDFAKPSGRDLIIDLVRRSDVLIENFRVGALAKYGLDYARLKEINPRLVYCSITGFGQTGPAADLGGYDFLVQAMGGLMSITGQPDGSPGAEPMKVGVAVTDLFTGLYATIAIQAALAARAHTGRGQYLDLALFDVQLAVLANQAYNYLNSGIAPVRLGNAHPNVVPYQTFATSDGFMILAVGNDQQFRRCCGVLGRKDLADDERYLTNALRVKNRDGLISLLRSTLVTRATAEWLALLQAEGVPCGPINTIEQALAEPQALARGLRLDIPHPLGKSPTIASPLRLSDTPVQYLRAPPLLGQDTDEVLGMLALDADAIARLRSDGVVR